MRNRGLTVFISTVLMLFIVWVGWLNCALRPRTEPTIGVGNIQRYVEDYYELFGHYPETLNDAEFRRIFVEGQDILLEEAVDGPPGLCFVALRSGGEQGRTYFTYLFRGADLPPLIQSFPSPQIQAEAQ